MEEIKGVVSYLIQWHTHGQETVSLSLPQPLAFTVFLQCYLSLGGGVCHSCLIYHRADSHTLSIEYAMAPNLLKLFFTRCYSFLLDVKTVV